MLTRSQTKVVIDFDAASIAWRANKKYIGNGTYVYISKTKMEPKRKNRMKTLLF